MADNRRTQIKSSIKRASTAVRAGANRLDRQALDELTELYRRSAYQIGEIVNSYADRDGTLRLDVMRELLGQTEAQIDQLSAMRNQLLDEKMLETAVLATTPFQQVASELNSTLTRIANDAVAQAKRFMDADGLQLSDRLWRLDNHAKRVVGDNIQTAIIQGYSAAQAAREFLSRGEGVPSSVSQNIRAANASAVSRKASAALLTAEGNPYSNALRVFRTEINRSHIEAYRNTAESHPDAIGTRFLLSPNHPEVDICDMHARANLYGLGPGVYPFGKSPLPAHPNTLSYEEIVWRDEITVEDRENKVERLDWLKSQSDSRQIQILGVRKAWMLKEGFLQQNMIATPWYVLKARLEKQGIDIPKIGGNSTPVTSVPNSSTSSGPWVDNASQTPWHIASFAQKSVVHKAIERHDANFGGVNIVRGGAYYVSGRQQISMSETYTTDQRRAQGTWRHEYGHYLDNEIARKQGLPVRFRSSMDDFSGPMRSETRSLTNLAGLGRASTKQRERFNDNRVAIENVSVRLGDLTDPQSRRNEIDQMARKVGFTLNEIEDAMDKDFILPLGTAEGDVRLARIITAIERRDVYQLMINLIPDDTNISGYRRKVHGKGLVGHFSDLLGSASKNRLAGFSGWGLGGHQNSYYKQFKENQYTEVFANFTTLIGGQEPFWAKLMDRLMPATTQRYREIVSNE